MKKCDKAPLISPELQRELGYFLRVRNRGTRVALWFWKIVLLWFLLLVGFAVSAEIIGLLLRRIH
jgi:hypothetical protein